MSDFFSNFPTTLYKNDETDNLDTVTNLTANFTIYNSIVSNSSSYYDYVISEGDTPETVSYKIYGNAEYHWLIMRVNGIMDIKTDWPLTYSQLMDTIEDTYGLAWAKTHYYDYYKLETRTLVKTGEINEEYVTIDASTYSSLTPSTTQYILPDGTAMRVVITKLRRTYYDYMMELNESKRTIRVIKAEYKDRIHSELQRVLRNG